MAAPVRNKGEKLPAAELGLPSSYWRCFFSLYVAPTFHTNKKETVPRKGKQQQSENLRGNRRQLSIDIRNGPTHGAL